MERLTPTPDDQYELSEEDAHIIDVNIHRFAAFMRRAKENRSLMESLPYGSSVVLMADENPEVNEVNQQVVEERLTSGEETYVFDLTTNTGILRTPHKPTQQ